MRCGGKVQEFVEIISPTIRFPPGFKPRDFQKHPSLLLSKREDVVREKGHQYIQYCKPKKRKTALALHVCKDRVAGEEIGTFDGSATHSDGWVYIDNKSL